MSLSETSQPISGAPTVDVAAEAAEPGRKFDVKALLANRTFQWVMLIIGAVVWCYWPLLGTEIWHRWTDMEGYYAHGFLIPLCSAYLVWDKWDKIKEYKVKPQYWALILMVPVLYVSLVASRAIMPTLLSVLLVATLLIGTLFVAGWKWALALSPAILFLFLGLPMFDKLIDTATFPLQVFSTKIAYHMLNLTGFQPFRGNDPTIIYVPHYSQPLTVAAACSGLKTTIAISAAVIFFILIARLSWWKNLILAAVAIPLSVLVNGIRIGLIGVACDTMPEWSGENFKQMHDMSGYVALGICFVALGWITKRLGYK